MRLLIRRMFRLNSAVGCLLRPMAGKQGPSVEVIFPRTGVRMILFYFAVGCLFRPMSLQWSLIPPKVRTSARDSTICQGQFHTNWCSEARHRLPSRLLHCPLDSRSTITLDAVSGPLWKIRPDYAVLMSDPYTHCGSAWAASFDAAPSSPRLYC
jgi:hypothetical protein